MPITSSTIKVPIELILNHPAYIDQTVVEVHVLTEYMMVMARQSEKDDTRRIVHLMQPAIDALLELHPIQVVMDKKERYYCIGGIRTLSIARNCLLPSETIPVTVLTGIKKDEARERCLIDVFMTSCLSLRNLESLYRILKLLPDDIKQKLISVDTGKVGIAKLINVDMETIRLWNKKNKL